MSSPAVQQLVQHQATNHRLAGYLRVAFWAGSSRGRSAGRQRGLPR